jgi:hypothetical protein
MVGRQKLDRGRAGRQNRLTSTQRVFMEVDQRGIGFSILPASVENCVGCAAGDEGSAYQKTWCGLFQSKEGEVGRKEKEICLYRGEGISGRSWKVIITEHKTCKSSPPLEQGPDCYVRG